MKRDATSPALPARPAPAALFAPSAPAPPAAQQSASERAPGAQACVPRRMLVLHQSADLYGSDRSLLELLESLDPRDFDAIICLPEDGPLAITLRKIGREVHVLPLLKISRKTFTIAGLAGLAMKCIGAVRALDHVLGQRRVDFVYTNTLAVFDGMLWALARRRPHIWHVREIIAHPWLASRLLRTLARFGADKLVCNSQKTRDWLCGARSDVRNDRRCSVVWNGVQVHPWAPANKAEARRQIGLLPDLPVLLMVARINHWKGHDLLLEAVAQLHASGQQDFQLVLLGSAAPRQEKMLLRLQALVAASPAAHCIHVRDFAANTADYYRAADCLVVPSRAPEPFGRVAIEAMAFGVPVVAADHGGLTEIVINAYTGLLFAPNDAHALCSALAEILAHQDRRARWGRNGYQRQQALFSLRAYANAMTAVFDSVRA